jgi:hypothetical protein
VFGNPGTYPLEGGYLYITPVGGRTQVYSLGFTASGLPQFTFVAQSPDVASGRVGTGPATVTTNQGQPGSGILWIVDPDAGLRAYQAVPSNGTLNKITLPASPSVSKYQRPGFGNNRYYISTSNGHILVSLTRALYFRSPSYNHRHMDLPYNSHLRAIHLWSSAPSRLGQVKL